MQVHKGMCQTHPHRGSNQIVIILLFSYLKGYFVNITLTTEYINNEIYYNRNGFHSFQFFIYIYILLS